MITISNVSKWYGTMQVLKNCSTEVAKGEVVVVCGPSGSGKSTLIKCVNGLEPFEEGTITVDGISVGDRKTDLPKLRARIGMVFQHFELFPHLSVMRNLALAQIKVLGRDPKAADEKGRKLLERVGLSAHADKFPGQLSGGQQQRVAIARALAMDPIAMLFDEPTSALDPEMINEVLDVMVARAAQTAGIAGLAFLSGIPGTIGGALRMNGGAYGGETKDVFVEARGVDRQGNMRSFSNGDMGFSYRHCSVPDDVTFTSAVFQGRAGTPEEIAAEMAAIKKKREASQPRNRTGGSTFKNPPGHSAWKLVDDAGCRGLTIGGAQVSELHSNFLINLGGASAADIETLGETVRERVKIHSGVELEWEIKRVGVKA